MKLLIVDDEASFRQHLSHLFVRKGYKVFEAQDGREAQNLAKENRFDVVLLDIVLPDFNGVEILKKFKQLYPDVQIIIMTGNATIENAIASMKLGAYDYLIKPFDVEELTILVDRASELTNLRREREISLRERDWQRKFDNFVGDSQHTKDILALIEKVAPTNSTVLITGETGTGKELVAKGIHRKSPRAEKPFVVVNCSAIQDTLLESEMFGYEKGAFTGASSNKRGLIEVANTGTLFLDEIGDVSPGFQTKLLRFLESGEYRPVGSTQGVRSDVRIIAATNRNLKKLLEEEKFREDLYYRLDVFNIHLIPLRDRPEDIPVLVFYCIKKICHRTGKCVKKISEKALEYLQNYSWPGNVRELENVLERAAILCNGKDITVNDFPADLKSARGQKVTSTNKQSLSEIEKEHILRTLQKENGNKTNTAKVLGISKKTLYHKLHLYGILD
jgi:DNA-binding NtrC family response regulator